MALTVKHTFVSAKGDGSDATLVRPSNWNENHDIELASNRIIGRLTAGPGDAEELPVTPYMIGLLNTVDFAALAVALGLPTTGDAKLTFKTVADAGWVLANDGSIGDALSGASYALPTYNTAALFTFFYNTFPDAICPVQTSTGAITTRLAQGTATTAFGAHCRMVLPKALGRAIIVAGTGVGLTNRGLATTGGEEAHTLTQAEMPAHAHTGTPAGSINNHDVNHTHQQQGTFGSNTVDVNHYHNQQGTFATDTRDINHTHQQQGTFGSGGMNRSNPHNHGVNTGVYGGTANAGVQGGGTYIGVVSTGNMPIGINNQDINHEHSTSISGSTGYMDQNSTHAHLVTIGGTTSYISGGSVSHAHSTTIYGGTGYMDSNNIHTHAFTGFGFTTSSVGSNVPSNIMQPWTAWNVMIKL